MRHAIIVLALLTAMGCSAQKEATPIPQPTATVVEERSPAGEPLAGMDGVLIKVTAKVKAIDLEKRIVTLVGPDGKVITTKAGNEIKRLNEVKVGDLVTIEYMQAVAFEVRPPTAEEKANPVAVAMGAGRADPKAAPAGGAGQVVHQIVKVTKIDKKDGTVTIKLADGRSETIKAKYPENLNRIKVGDTAAVTFAETMAISLTPASK